MFSSLLCFLYFQIPYSVFERRGRQYTLYAMTCPAEDSVKQTYTSRKSAVKMQH